MSLIPKHELRKIKQHVAKLRKQGHDILTDDEVERNGWVTDHMAVKDVGLPVKKERQKESWDCGLACARMVLGVLGDVTPSPALLKERVAGESVWTIDLAYLFSDFNVTCEYWTKTPTVEEAAYQGSSFYSSSLEEDARRVNTLFQRAADEGVKVRKATLSAAELWNLMREEDTLVIALVDAQLLHQRVVTGHTDRSGDAGGTKETKSSPRGRKNASPPRGKNKSPRKDRPTSANRVESKKGGVEASFSGHYVLLVGLDDERGGFLINDPARDDERTFVHSDALEAARRAEGTDEDLLLVPAYQSTPTLPATGSKPKIVQVLEKAALAAKAKADGDDVVTADGGEASSDSIR